MRLRHLLLVMVLLVFGIGIYYWVNRPVVVIGDWKITKQDLIQRRSVVESYFPNASPGAAQKQLETSAKYLKILQAHGVEITNQDIQIEEARIDQQTKNPEHLKKIKDMFKGNMEAYRKNYVLPALVDRVIYFDFFLNNHEVQKGPTAKAFELIEKSKSGEFEKLAKEMGLFVRVAVVDASGVGRYEREKQANQETNQEPSIKDISPKPNPEVLDRVKKTIERSDNETPWANQVLQKLERNQVFERPLNSEQSLLVVQLIERSKSGAKIRVAFVEKLNFDVWVAEQSQKLGL